MRKIRAHRGVINSLDRTIAGGAGVELVATGADDGMVHIWEGGDEGGKQAVATFEVGCPVTSVAWSADGSNVYVGALDNEIHVRHCVSFVYKDRSLKKRLIGLRHSQKRRSLHLKWTQ